MSRKPPIHLTLTPERGAALYGRCRECSNILWPGVGYDSQRGDVCRHCHNVNVRENRALKREYYAARNWYR
jgi:hypothetical protein